LFGPYKLGPHRSRPRIEITLGLCSRVYRICATWRRGHKKHSCDIILMISLLWLHVLLFITKLFHVSIISPNCCYISNSLCLKRFCVALFHKRCLWSQHTFHNKSIINPRWWWLRSWVGMYLEKANVGLGFFLRNGCLWDMGKLLQLETIMYSVFFWQKFVVFWTKNLGMICEINKKPWKFEYNFILLFFWVKNSPKILYHKIEFLFYFYSEWILLRLGNAYAQV
jgi:hypothetical protein